jgi:hypothetical protein
MRRWNGQSLDSMRALPCVLEQIKNIGEKRGQEIVFTVGFAIHAAKFGPEADLVARAVGEKPTPREFQIARRNEGPLSDQ